MFCFTIITRLLGMAAFVLSYVVATQEYHFNSVYQGRDFLREWTWQTLDDPTHGRVNYVDQGTALAANLSYASDKKFVMRADSCRKVQSTARGRDSVRIMSNAAYNESVIILDLSHMPTGCGTWPAFWTLSKAGPWPSGGEIDIIEGVHTNTQNLASLHTLPGCYMQEPRGQKGQTVSSDCDTNVNNNQGCGTTFIKTNSYGTGFNKVGGGWYVIERSRVEGISVWFWSRDDSSVPLDVSRGCDILRVGENWGDPEARFAPDKCNHQSFFDSHQMIFDTTFCGDWAGATYNSSGCGQIGADCNEFVDNNPEKFVEAYWEINSLRVYV